MESSWCHHIEIRFLSLSFCKQRKGTKNFGLRHETTFDKCTLFYFGILCERQRHLRSVDRFWYWDNRHLPKFFLSLWEIFLSLVFRCSFAIKISFFASTESRSKLNVMHLIRVIDNLPKRQQRKYASSDSSEMLYTALTISLSFAHLWRYFNVIQGIQKSMLFSLQLPNNRFIYLRPSCHFEI